MANLPPWYQFDPNTGANTIPGARFNGMTGLPLRGQFDPATGQNLIRGAAYNGMTGKPLFQFHPETGQNLIPNARFNGMTGAPLNNPALPVRFPGQFDPATGFNRIPGARFNGMTGQPLPELPSAPTGNFGRPALPAGTPVRALGAGSGGNLPARQVRALNPGPTVRPMPASTLPPPPPNFTPPSPQVGQITNMAELNALRQQAGFGPASGPTPPPAAPPPAAARTSSVPPRASSVPPGYRSLYTSRPGASPTPGASSSQWHAGHSTYPTRLGPPAPSRRNQSRATSRTAAASNRIFRGGTVSPTGAVGSRLPTPLVTDVRTGLPKAPGVRSLPGWATRQQTFQPGPNAGKISTGAARAGNMGLAMGASLAAGATPGLIGDAMGVTPGSYTDRTLSDIATVGALSAPAGIAGIVPVAGVALGDVAAGNDWVRDNIINDFRENVLGKGPTDDTMGDILGRAPLIGGFFGGDRGASDQAAAAPDTPQLPPRESLLQAAVTAGLDDMSTTELGAMYDQQVALHTAMFQADPATYQATIAAELNSVRAEGEPEIAPEDVTLDLLTNIAYQQTLQSLPNFIAGQSSREQALAQAQMYQAALSQYIAPMQQGWADVAAQAEAAGMNPQTLAAYQAAPLYTEQTLRLQPTLDAMEQQAAYDAQVAQQIQAQQIQAQVDELTGGGGEQTLEELLAAGA